MSLFVGRISDRVTSRDFEELFAKYGKVRRCDLLTGKGYGFVDFEDRQDGETAIREVNGQEFFGRKLIIEWAKSDKSRDGPSRESRGDRDRGTSRYSKSRSPPRRRYSRSRSRDRGGDRRPSRYDDRERRGYDSRDRERGGGRYESSRHESRGDRGNGYGADRGSTRDRGGYSRGGERRDDHRRHETKDDGGYKPSEEGANAWGNTNSTTAVGVDSVAAPSLDEWGKSAPMTIDDSNTSDKGWGSTSNAADTITTGTNGDVKGAKDDWEKPAPAVLEEKDHEQLKAPSSPKKQHSSPVKDRSDSREDSPIEHDDSVQINLDEN